MDEAVALRQLRKLWRGSGLRIVAFPRDEGAAAVEAPAPESAAAASSSSPAGPRRQTLADFEPAPEPPEPPEPPAPPKPAPRPPPRRPDIGLALGGIGRCVDSPRQVMPLGKAHGKRPMAEVAAQAAQAAASAAEAEEAARKRAFRASEEQKLEAQRLERARALENAADHPTIMRQALDAWRREGIAV